MKKKTGATIHQMNNKVDSGDIYLQKAINIENDDSLLSLSQKISKINNEILLMFFMNSFDKPVKQNLKKRTHFKSPAKADIDDFNRNKKKFFTFKHLVDYLKYVLEF